MPLGATYDRALYSHTSVEIFHFRRVPKTSKYIILRVFFVVQDASYFCGDIVYAESLFFRLGHDSRETLVGRKPRKLALTRGTNPSRCHTSLARYFLLVPRGGN